MLITSAVQTTLLKNPRHDQPQVNLLQETHKSTNPNNSWGTLKFRNKHAGINNPHP
jgi:hypothetical protein